MTIKMKDTIKHISDLAKLQLSDEELESFSKKAKNVLDYVQMLNKLNTDDVAPMKTAEKTVNTIFRDDKPVKFEATEEIIDIAPERKGPFVKVPQVIEGE